MSKKWNSGELLWARAFAYCSVHVKMDKIVISFPVILENRPKLRPGAWAYKIQRDLQTLIVNSFAKFPNVARYGSVRDIRLQTWPGRHIEYAEMLFRAGR